MEPVVLTQALLLAQKTSPGLLYLLHMWPSVVCRRDVGFGGKLQQMLTKCPPSGSLAWLMSRSTESFRGQGFAPGAVQRGLYPQQAQSMQEGKAETVS